MAGFQEPELRFGRDIVLNVFVLLKYFSIGGWWRGFCRWLDGVKVAEDSDPPFSYYKNIIKYQFSMLQSGYLCYTPDILIAK